jgi:hypothetical protein
VKRALAMGVAAVVLSGGAALADPPLATRVEVPYVFNGVSEIELRGGSLVGGPGEGESAAILEFERGWNDRLRLGLEIEFEDHAGGEPPKTDSIALEGAVYLGQIPHTGVDVGVYGEYEQRIHNESGVGELKLLLARQIGPVRAIVNLNARQPFTRLDDEGATEFAYAAEATVEAAPNLRLGLEALGDLGTNRAFGGPQGHYVGPMLNWEIHPQGFPAEIELQASYLFPLGAARDESDGAVRLMIELERHF